MSLLEAFEDGVELLSSLDEGEADACQGRADADWIHHDCTDGSTMSVLEAGEGKDGEIARLECSAQPQ